MERKFTEGKLIGVVTTAALGAGVDFPASQVIFDALSMGISWLTVGEFNQMAGRAGRPDFHDLGRVVVLAEPGATYSRESRITEEEMALLLLKGEMEEVAPVYDRERRAEELVANAVVCKGGLPDLHTISESMVGALEPVLDEMVEAGLAGIQENSLVLTSLSRVMAEHFIGMERLLEIRRLVTKVDDPVAIVAELECEQTRDERIREVRPGHGNLRHGEKKGHQRDSRQAPSEKKPTAKKRKRKRS